MFVRKTEVRAVDELEQEEPQPGAPKHDLKETPSYARGLLLEFLSEAGRNDRSLLLGGKICTGECELYFVAQ
jgi:hypothetical protein